MVVAPIDDGDTDRRRSKCTGSSQTREAAADDHDIFPAHHEPLEIASSRLLHGGVTHSRLCPDCEQLSRAIRPSASRSWELNHGEPRERTARELLEPAPP